MRARLFAFLRFISQPAVALGGAVLIAAIAVGVTWYTTRVSPTGDYTAAMVAPITQEVDVSGPVQGAQTTTLSFQIPGAVASIPIIVGEHVSAGQTLVTLDGGSQAAALLAAQANLQTAQANLAQLTAGTRSQQLTIDQNAVAEDQIALSDAISSAYVAADSAVYVAADPLFTNPRTASAALTVIVPDQDLANTVVQERIALEPVLTAWGAQISSPSFGAGDLSGLATSSVQNLTEVNNFLNDFSSALVDVQPSPTLSASALAAYEANITEARTSTAGALSALTGAETSLIAAQGALALAQAGATPQAIAEGQAQVSAAQAAVDAAQVVSDETVLVAPISGTITAQNANPGQTVAPGTPLVSMQGDGAFEAKVPISDSDIGQVKIGEAVTATFDAYPGVTFPAVITEVDPAATVTNGVSSYMVTATFTSTDPRIQSGLTAYLAIITASAPNAIVIPTSAIISNATSQFVYVKSTGKDVQTPVTVGIQSASGMTQILSGLSAGEQVLTFGDTE
jgi:RND family efflux transporter MFP subunit